MTISTFNLIDLEIPVPPQLEETIGYQGKARYVAFYWQPAGDEVMYDDGQVGGTGNCWAWLAYVDHPAVAPHLVRPCQTCGGRDTTDTLHNDPCLDCDGAGVHLLNLGSSDYPADRWLILDREERKVYAARVELASQFLQQQWPPAPELTAEQQEALSETIQKAVKELNQRGIPLTDEEIAIRLEEAKQAHANMTAWLDSAAEALEELAPVHGRQTAVEMIRQDDELALSKSRDEEVIFDD